MTSTTTPQGTVDLELAIGGMTCASCAARVERKLNRLESVTASVNYATEKAKIKLPAGMDPGDLIGQVEAAGYTAALPSPPAADAAAGDQPDPTRPLRDRLLVSLVLSGPVVVLAMLAPLQFRYWQWPRWSWPRRWSWGRPGRSTGPPGRTYATAPRPWTR
jgi:Cu+-exporting ATPase